MVKNESLMKEIISNIEPGNVIIIVSGKESATGTTPDFDCGLTTQNMFIAATSMGLAISSLVLRGEAHETASGLFSMLPTLSIITGVNPAGICSVPPFALILAVKRARHHVQSRKNCDIKPSCYSGLDIFVFVGFID